MTEQTPDNRDVFETLAHEAKRLNDHRYMRIHNSYFSLLGYQFLRGVAFGLGSVVGATIVVSFLAYFLSEIDFIPIIGEWASQIAKEITLKD